MDMAQLAGAIASEAAEQLGRPTQQQENSSSATQGGDVVLTSEQELLSDDQLDPYDFGTYPPDFYLSKFTWAVHGMPAFLKALNSAQQRRQSQIQLQIHQQQQQQQQQQYRRAPHMNMNMIPQQPTYNQNEQQQMAARRMNQAMAASRLQQQKQQQLLLSRPPQQPPPPQAKTVPRPTPTHQRPTCVPIVTAKPIRRLAKVRPYANQAIPVSADEILKAIPSGASSYFHVMDRRVNMDAIPASSNHNLTPPIYSLLRAWVQDDPCRQVPPTVDLPLLVTANTRATVSPLASTDKKRGLENGDDNGRLVKKKRATLNVIDHVARAHTNSNAVQAEEEEQPSADQLKSLLVHEAKQKKKQKKAPHRRKQDFAKILARLRER